MVITNSLDKFGPEFQSKAIASLLDDRKFLDQVYDIVDPKHFESEAHAWIVDRTMWYFKEYKNLPTVHVFKQELDKHPNKDTFKQPLITALEEVYSNMKSSDLVYVKDEYLEFCRTQTLKNAILKSVDKLEVGDYNGIKTLIDKAMRAGQARDYGHNWKLDIDSRTLEDSRNTVATGWPVLDELMDGGLANGELGIIMAPSGAGKSWVATAIGKAALYSGKKVLQFSLELNEKYTGNRYDTLITGIETKQLKHNVDKIKDAIDRVSGELIVKFYPPRAATVNTLMAQVKKLQSIGFDPDLIIVDYGDLLRPTERGGNRYEDLGIVYEELRGMAGELQIPVWTASQTQRSSLNDDIIEADKIAESFQKVMTADFVMSLSRKTSDKLTNTGRLHVIKNRFGADGMTFYGDIDYSRGVINFVSQESAEGRRIQNLMKNGDNEVKSMLLDKLTKFKNRDTDLDDLG